MTSGQLVILSSNLAVVVGGRKVVPETAPDRPTEMSSIRPQLPTFRLSPKHRQSIRRGSSKSFRHLYQLSGCCAAESEFHINTAHEQACCEHPTRHLASRYVRKFNCPPIDESLRSSRCSCNSKTVRGLFGASDNHHDPDGIEWYGTEVGAN